MSFPMIEQVPAAGATVGSTFATAIGNKDDRGNGTLAALVNRLSGAAQATCYAYPTNAAGVTLTTGGTANVLGTMVVLIPANTVGYDFVLTDLVMESSFTNAPFTFALYAGADGSEQLIGTYVRCRGSGAADAPTEIRHCPIIPANTQVKIAAARNGTSGTVTLSCRYAIPLGETPAPPAPSAYPSNAIGFDALALYDAMDATAHAELAALNVFLMTMSVGSSITGVDPAGWGSEDLGYAFDFVDAASDFATTNRGHRTFATTDANGKLADWQTWVVTNALGGAVDCVGMKFCFTNFGAELSPEWIAALKVDYQARVSAIKAAYPSLVVVHFAPPLSRADAYAVATANTIRIAWKNWLCATYPDDYVIDMQDVESRNAAGEQELYSGVPVLTTANSSDSGGHLSEAGALACAKAMLYGIYLANQ